MTPREERRFRLVWIVGLPLAGVLGFVASEYDWSIGLIYLTLITLAVSAVVFVHFNPLDRFRRRR
jgi:ABC-type branched-subunit amino acid transport system permease subunit